MLYCDVTENNITWFLWVLRNLLLRLNAILGVLLYVYLSYLIHWIKFQNNSRYQKVHIYVEEFGGGDRGGEERGLLKAA